VAQPSRLSFYHAFALAVLHLLVIWSSSGAAIGSSCPHEALSCPAKEPVVAVPAVPISCRVQHQQVHDGTSHTAAGVKLLLIKDGVVTGATIMTLLVSKAGWQRVEVAARHGERRLPGRHGSDTTSGRGRGWY
jgi:hypothetical protein